jgi:hypothetical protein
MRRIIQGHLTRVSLAVSFSALFFAIIWIAGRATPLAQFVAGASIITVFAHAIAALGWSGRPALLWHGLPLMGHRNLLLGQSVQRPSTRLQLFAVPITSAFVMVQWDVVMDPSGSTLARAWVWYGGGGYFGVPLSNFLGWFLVTYLYYQAFSFVPLRARDEAALSLPPACLLGTANIVLPRRRSLPRPAALRSGHPPRRRRRPGMVGGGPARNRRNRHALHHAADLHSGALSACSP